MTVSTTKKAVADAEASMPDIREIESFIHHEVGLLDERRFDEWMELFTEDGYYWVPTQPGQQDPLRTASLFYDDRRAMKARFIRLKHPRIHVQTPASRTRHVVSGIRLEPPEGPGECLVSSSFLMLEYRPGYEQRLYGGKFLHRLRYAQGRLAIRMKRADLINCDASFGAIAIPF
jgi:3-phenylpropionate/cinnamic acid dioxygenase small subunit